MGLLSRKRILLAGNEGIALYGPTAGNGVEREISIAWEVPNFNQQLTNALSRQNPGAPVLILFDADHAYRKGDDIPKLNFFDKPLFIKRKLDQAFPNYPVRASFEIAAAKKPGGEKPPSSYLFAAISETDRIDRLAKSILDAGVPVAGLGLLPIESEGLVMTLSRKLFGHKGKDSRWVVLIGQHETGGLRQVVVKDGHLALTRMTPVSEAGAQGEGWVEEVMREFKATLTYIARFGYTPAEGLDVIVIGGEAEKRFFEVQKFLPGSNFQCVKISDALEMVGAKGKNLGDTNFGDAVHAAWASQKKFLSAPVQVDSIRRIMLPRLGAHIGGILMFLSLIGLMGFVFSVHQDYLPLKEQVEQRQGQKKFLTLEYEQESKVFEAFPVKPAFIRQALAVNDYLENNQVNTTPIFHLLRNSLDDDVKVEDLKFEYKPPVLREVPAVNRSAPPPKPVDPNAPPDRGTVVVDLRFSLKGNLTLEQRVARAERLVQKMTGIFTAYKPGYTVRVSSQFGNVSGTGSFSGAFGKSPEELAASRADMYAGIQIQGPPP